METQGRPLRLPEGLLTLINGHLQQRHFSHIYLARFVLDSNQPVYQWQCLPGHRSVFDLASLTKALVTANLAVAHIPDGRCLSPQLDLGDWLGAHRTEFCQNIQKMRVWDLLSHRSGLPPWRNFWTCRLGTSRPADRAAVLERLNLISAQIPSGPHPYVYSDLGYILLGFVLEALQQKNLSQVFSDWLQRNHIEGCRDLFFGQQVDRNRAVPASFCRVRQRWLVGEVHDENAAAMGGHAGHAGLFGSGPDLIRFLRGLIQTQSGAWLYALNAGRLSDPDSPLLGWQRYRFFSEQMPVMGHMGFTGTAFWIDPQSKKGAVLLTNRVASSRISPWIQDFRCQVFEELLVKGAS